MPNFVIFLLLLLTNPLLIGESERPHSKPTKTTRFRPGVTPMRRNHTLLFRRLEDCWSLILICPLTT